MRSFTLLAGFWLSSFATICGFTPAATRFRRTSGVRPISSVTFAAMFMRDLLARALGAGGQDNAAARAGVIRSGRRGPNSSSSATLA